MMSGVGAMSLIAIAGKAIGRLILQLISGCLCTIGCILDSENPPKGFCYTFGLESFGYKDLEIIDSRRPFEATQELMYNIAYFVLDSGIHLSDCETIGLSATQRLKISHCPGVFPEGETIKIKF